MVSQESTPYLDALLKYVKNKTIPFHTPGHKQGKGVAQKFRNSIGEKALKLDLDIDDIENYENVLEEAEKLATQAYGADYSFFLVNGSTSGVLTMILSTCSDGDEIIVPRGAHKSIFAGIILAGATPVFIPSEIDEELHIPYNINPRDIEKAIEKHPNAKAVIIVNPNYYGLATDMKKIAQITHKANKLLLVDEAWGAHFKFHPLLPCSATEAGADMCANSTHKLLSGMTQTSMLHIKGNKVNPARVRAMINLIQTTSPSCLLRASLDCARMQMATEGKKLLTKTIDLATKARQKINKIPGLYCFGRELIGKPGVYDMDTTRLTINVKNTGHTGYEVEQILQTTYKIKIEMSELFNIVVIISIGDSEQDIDYLVSCLIDFTSTIPKKNTLPKKYNKLANFLHHLPQQVLSPHSAVFGKQKAVKLTDSIGEVSAELITAFPPGVPLLLPGEKISKEIIEYIQLERAAGMQLNGAIDPTLKTIVIIEG
ncbi:MAG: aminotransferase class I/II-fold pyridoxal phosphate-dependent enzyme [Candidatus Stahlbacteria bacterium]|nr:aminotransferase class I/II-fold pyridoxal phosphate-dependent enzyme [Candidatus Stahlbacteria bacterium]